MVSPLRTESTDATASPKKRPSTQAVNIAADRLEPARMVIFVALCGYAGVGIFTEWWPIGWLNLAQALVFGAYSPKMSAVVFLFFAIVGLQLGVLALARVFASWLVGANASTSSLAASRPAANTVTLARPPGFVPTPAIAQSRMLVRMGIGTIVAIWIVGAVTFFWLDIHQRGDNEAVYTLLRIDGDSPIDVSLGEHVAVEGVVLASHVLFYRSDSHSLTSSHYLVPIVPQDWRPGIPVRLLLQVDDRSNLPGYRASTPTRPWSLPEPVLSRVTSSASLIERIKFEKTGLQLAPDYRVLDFVASRGGRPVQLHVDYLESVVGFATVGSVAMSIVYVAAFFRVRRRERADAITGAAKPMASVRQPRSRRGLQQCAPMGVACALIGALAGVWVALTATGTGYGAFAIAAPLAGLSCGAGAWWLLVVRVSRYTRRRGALTGALAVVCAHYLCWCLVMASASVAHTWRNPWIATAKDGPDVFGALGAALVLTFGSLLFLGWATLPSGVICGAVLARRQGRTQEPHQTR